MRYELLKEGDIIKEGDEYYREKLPGGDSGWFPSSYLGCEINKNSIPHRRALPDKPKVRLEELVKLAHKNMTPIINDIEAENLVKSICTHLGIEIEPQKEEWERAYEKYTREQAVINEGISIEELSKSMFEAGQACEKARSK